MTTASTTVVQRRRYIVSYAENGVRTILGQEFATEEEAAALAGGVPLVQQRFRNQVEAQRWLHSQGETKAPRPLGWWQRRKQSL
jgi:hypothetical protein